MSKKDLEVLAECVDIRNGRRFAAGETFDPAPSPDQAKRLIAAGCLPDSAIGATKATPDPNEQPKPLAENVKMRTEAVERKARAADAEASDRQAASVGSDPKAAKKAK